MADFERTDRRDRGGGGQGQASGDEARLGVLEMIELGPVLMRMGLTGSLRAAGWATSSSVAVARRIAAAARAGESPVQLMADARDEAIGAAREALGVTDIEATLGRITSEGEDGSEQTEEQKRSLRERGEELLARSARLEPDDEGHPAFGVVLEELAPDEVRILRMLRVTGPQAAVDVEASGPLGGGNRPQARRLSLIADLAGCRHPERIQLYFDNLLRLGLLRLEDEPLEDEAAYELLEAQQAVSDAKDDASSGVARAKIVRRRLELTEFGRSFAETCLPLEEERPAERRRPPPRRAGTAPRRTRSNAAQARRSGRRP